MSGDYSRRSFDAKNNYSGVLLQQGRVQLDSDFNEIIDIQNRRWQAETLDLIGGSGVQAGSDAFKIKWNADKNELTLGIGRMYVNGILVENHGDYEAEAEAETQAQAQENGKLNEFNELIGEKYYLKDLNTNIKENEKKTITIYLDVWSREVSYLQKQDIRESAIGIDTSTRLENVWKVRLAPGDYDEGELNPKPASRLTTSYEDDGNNRKNRFYRVEIHDGGDAETATLKWSRDNISVAAAVSSIKGNVVEIRREQRDAEFRFKRGQLVEITNDEIEMDRKNVGFTARVEDVDIDGGTITLEDGTIKGPVDTWPPQGKNWRILRWDNKNGEVKKLSEKQEGFIELENKIKVKLDLVKHNVETLEFKNGEYWQFAWRGTKENSQELLNAPPAGVHHHICPLAEVEVKDQNQKLIKDLRPTFRPLNIPILDFNYASGSGQEGTAGSVLPLPLQVSVFKDGNHFIAGKVRFKVIDGGGLVDSTNFAVDPTEIECKALISDGLAMCRWKLGTLGIQHVEAQLMSDDDVVISHPIRFMAKATHSKFKIHSEERIKLINPAMFLRNDSVVTINQLLGGIKVTTTEEISDACANCETCVLTLELPLSKFINHQRKGKELVTIVVVPGSVEIESNTLLWNFDHGDDDADSQQNNVLNFLNSLENEKILARFTLNGRFIWASENENGKRDYLIGDVPGRSETSNGTQRIALDFDNPLGSPGSDFEMWFWLTNGNTIAVVSD